MRRSCCLLLPCAAISAGCVLAGGDPAGRYGRCASYSLAIQGLPEAKAEKSVQRGDPRPLGIDGFAPVVPPWSNIGVPPPPVVAQAMAERGVRVIQGTSDNLTDAGCLAFRLDAQDFAARYNRALARLNSARAK